MSLGWEQEGGAVGGWAHDAFRHLQQVWSVKYHPKKLKVWSVKHHSKKLNVWTVKHHFRKLRVWSVKHKSLGVKHHSINFVQ